MTFCTEKHCHWSDVTVKASRTLPSLILSPPASLLVTGFPTNQLRWGLIHTVAAGAVCFKYKFEELLQVGRFVFFIDQSCKITKRVETNEFSVTNSY